MTVIATTLDAVRLNFQTQIEGVSPHYSKISRGFLLVDRLEFGEKGNTTGRARDFTVVRRGAAGDREPTRSFFREAIHGYEITVSYPTAVGRETDLHEMIAKDRHQLIEALRDSTAFDTANTGLWDRRRVADRLDDAGPVWAMVYQYDVRARENVYAP